MIQQGNRGKSFIQRAWQKGPLIWQNLKFVISPRDNYPFKPTDLPPYHKLLPYITSGSSTFIRESINQGQTISGLVRPSVQDYIRRHKLFHTDYYDQDTTCQISDPRIIIFSNQEKEETIRFEQMLFGLVNKKGPNMIVVLGGDGTMLHAIRKYWRLRLPFFGINLGHRGHLLNDIKTDFDLKMLAQKLHLRTSPLLYVETKDQDGSVKSIWALNDAWLMAKPGKMFQAAWFEVAINGKVRVPRLVADAVLVATAAGSTGYARSMGGPSFEVGTPSLVVVGSNISDPSNFKAATPPNNSVVKFTNISPGKRLTLVYADSLGYGVATELTARTSRIAAADILLMPDYNFAEKLINAQFQGF